MKAAARVTGWVMLLAFVYATEAPASAEPSAQPSAPDCGPRVDKPDGQPWRCTFADEFDGTELDASKWQPLTTVSSNLRGGNDCWVDSQKNITVSDGFLHLTSRREDKPFTCTKPDGTTAESQVSSGSVTTFGAFAQTYGRWDIRARFPEVTLPGSQGSVWITPQEDTYGAWPTSGEIDIAEFYSLYPDRVVPYVHYGSSADDRTVTNTLCLVKDPWNFHTYSMTWTPGQITITIDGARCVGHEIHPSSPLQGSQPFDQPFVLNLTQTMGVGTNTPLPGTPLPLTTDIDYVRVWN